MKTQSLIFCLGLLLAAPAYCEEINPSNSMPLKVMHYRAHGWYGDLENIEAAEGKRSLFDSETPDSSIEEIGFERELVDSVRFLSSGPVRYWGARYAEKTGCYKANLPDEELTVNFQVLARILDQIGISDMADTYSTLSWHGDSEYTSVVRAGKRKTVLNYNDAAPAELFLFRELLLRRMEELKWKKVRRADSTAECLGLASELTQVDSSGNQAPATAKPTAWSASTNSMRQPTPSGR